MRQRLCVPPLRFSRVSNQSVSFRRTDASPPTSSGAALYPRYTVSRSGSAFACRQDLLAYEQSLAEAGRLEAALQEDDYAAAEAHLAPALAAVAAGEHKAPAVRAAIAAAAAAAAAARAAAAEAEAEAQWRGPLEDCDGGCDAGCSSSSGGGDDSGAAQQHSPQDARSPCKAAASSAAAAAAAVPNATTATSAEPDPGSLQTQPTAAAAATSATAATSRPAELVPQTRPPTAPDPAAQTVSTSSPASRGGAGNDTGGGGGGISDVAAGAATDAPLPFLARFRSAWVYAGMGTVGVSLFEKQRRYGEAVDLLHRLLEGVCCPSR